jgi:hypothetical protein
MCIISKFRLGTELSVLFDKLARTAFPNHDQCSSSGGCGNRNCPSSTISSMTTTAKTSYSKRVRSRSRSPQAEDLYDVGDYVPYVPVAKRRQERVKRLEQLASTDEAEARRRQREEAKRREEEADEERQADEAREEARRQRTLLDRAQEVKQKKAEEGKSALINVQYVTYLRCQMPRRRRWRN